MKDISITTINSLLVASAVAVLFVSAGGCSKEPEPVATPAPRSTPATPAPSASASETAETTTVKTMDEYRSEADQKITAANAESELSKLEQEINADR